MSGIPELNSFTVQNTLETTLAIRNAKSRDRVSPSGKVIGSVKDSLVSSALGTLGNNPIIASGVDVLANVLETAANDLVNTAIKDVSGAIKPLQTAADVYFMIVSLVTTGEVEILMEIARGSARSILATLDQKDRLITEINTEITALFNAVSTVLNTQPFFTSYLGKLIEAFSKINTANHRFKSVVSVLTTKHFYNSVEFEKGFSELEAAEALILPDPTADVSKIRSNTLQEGSNSTAHAKDGLAAAASLPGISANIARKVVIYTELTLKIDGLISLFLTALTDYINTYKRNINVDQSTINHINSGTVRIDSLLAQMGTVLFPGGTSNKNIAYSAQVITSANAWGIELAGIIEWLRVQPGKASKQLDLTGESVRRYNAAIELLKTFNSITVGSAILKVTESQEDALNTGMQVVRALFNANTILATTKDTSNIKFELKRLLDLFQAARQLDASIRGALMPFVTTTNNLTASAAKVVNNIISIADKLGLDRAGDFLRSANITGFFSINADLSTYIGAAIAGVRGIINTVSSSPNGTDQDREKLEALQSNLSRKNAVKKVEAARGSTNTIDSFVADKKAGQKQVSKDTSVATQIAAKYSPPGTLSQTAYDTIKGQLKNVTGDALGLLSDNVLPEDTLDFLSQDPSDFL
jgi:hypothetical protein